MLSLESEKTKGMFLVVTGKRKEILRSKGGRRRKEEGKGNGRGK